MALLGGCVGDNIDDEKAESEGQADELNDWRDDLRNWRDWWRSLRDGGAGTRDASTPPTFDAGTPTRDAGTQPTPDAGTQPEQPGEQPTATCPNGQPQPAAAGLRIREVALYQTLKIPLVSNGAPVATRALPIVQGKKALVRVFVDPVSGYARHAVRGVLSVRTGGKTTELRDERTIAAASTDQDPSSTFSFQVDPALIGGDTQLTVSLREPNCGVAGGQARDTQTSALALNAAGLGTLKVVIVPVNIGGKLPVTDATQIANMRAALLAFYPVPNVEVTVRKTPLTWTGGLSASNQTQWSSLLNAVLNERRKDNAPSDVYYYGLAKPTATFSQFCARGCIMGIAPQTTRVQPSAQGGLSVGFEDNQSYETVVHEIGHAHGRGHAPCVTGGSIAGVDKAYPIQGGLIGTWGWDSRTNKLIEPNYKDVMGYCRPNWISGYTYSGLATRSQQVNERALIQLPVSSERWHNVLVFADGTAQWGGAIETYLPGGETEKAQALDASGAVVAEIEIVRVELSDSTDQFVYIPEPRPTWAAIQIGDRKIELAKIAAAPQ